MQAQYAKTSPRKEESSQLPVRVVQFSLVSPSAAGEGSMANSQELSLSSAPVYLYIVLFPASAFPLAKAFWQHTGDGISSRLAEHSLRILAEMGRVGDDTPSPGTRTPLRKVEDETSEPVHRRYSKNRHYSRASTSNAAPSALAASVPITAAIPALRAAQDTADPDAELESGSQSAYVEERYGRNLPASSASLAKKVLKRRIAGTLLADRLPPPNPAEDGLQSKEHEVGTTAREGTQLSEDDVFLFPTGMSSIFHAHQTALRWRKRSAGADKVGMSVCFGFPYTDTLKILQKWGPGCHFFGNGQDSDLDDLEKLLQAQSSGSGEAPVLSLFCEFPSNPLLRCPDLPRIRRLADQHNFIVVVDETIGNFLNVEVLPYADIVVSSLTKVFSGDANVMGGSMVINPQSVHKQTLRAALEEEYEDNYWGVDSVFMERNSRDFASRVERIDLNAEALADLLYGELLKERNNEVDKARQVIKGVYYPKYISRNHYDACRRTKNLLGSGSTSLREGGGYGGLFSIIFTSTKASTAFYDELKCAKGPSLGTNFTLASPYAILAHYTELEWAAQFGVDSALVRVSTGLEETEELKTMFNKALEAARNAV